MPETWPDWPIVANDPSAHARELSRYVDVTQTWRLVPVDCFSPWKGAEAGRLRAERLYEELRSRRIPYAFEPWNPVPYGPVEQARYGSAGTMQRVRGPNETIQGPATCLDLALVFAGMAMSAEMRPFIALRSTGEPHALIVLPIKRARSLLDDREAFPPGFTQRAAEPGVWDLATQDGLTFRGSDDWLVVDVYKAARMPASSRGRGELPETGSPACDATPKELGFSGDVWTLVDVDRVRRTPLEPYQPPTGSSVPAIHGCLPALRAFIDYPTRRGLLQDLHVQVGPRQLPATIVLHGAQGRGKSMLARRLAVAADHGCGWFLNATDDKILTRSLAQAERQELGNRGDGPTSEGVDAIDDRALASAALRRLRASDEPWVVVLDNCDSRPDLPGLRELIPRPRTNGQCVIITTTHPGWQKEAKRSGWNSHELLPLGEADLAELGLPVGADGPAYDSPLIAQALKALYERAGVAIPRNTCTDGPALVWHLLRMSEHQQPVVGEMARLLAWCPPEPVDAERLGQISGGQHAADAGERLAELSFVTPTFNDGRLAIQMHRLFAAAVRRQTWRDNPAMAVGILSSLLRHKEGRRIFIEAEDSTALSQMEREGALGEPGDVARAATVLADPSEAGLLWHGIGHVRERRGPVAASGPHFDEALQHLNRSAYPYEAAESLIGLARVVYQNDQSSAGQLAEARAQVAEARDLLTPQGDPATRELREQGNALSWLIARKLAGRERNPRKRESELTEVTEQLWLSYEARLRLIRGPESGAIERGAPPVPTDGQSAERAYYNLSGAYLELAKVHHELANGEPPGSERRRELLAQAGHDLAQARTVYQHVRRLREKRHLGQPHPHLAACVQGEAYIAYYRAALLGEDGALMDSFELTAEAMRQRQVVASGMARPGSRALLRNGDVRKSGKFMLKVAIAMLLVSSSRPSAGAEDVMGETREALREVLGRVSWPSQTGLIGVSDGG